MSDSKTSTKGAANKRTFPLQHTSRDGPPTKTSRVENGYHHKSSYGGAKNGLIAPCSGGREEDCDSDVNSVECDSSDVEALLEEPPPPAPPRNTSCVKKMHGDKSGSSSLHGDKSSFSSSHRDKSSSSSSHRDKSCSSSSHGDKSSSSSLHRDKSSSSSSHRDKSCSSSSNRDKSSSSSSEYQDASEGWDYSISNGSGRFAMAQKSNVETATKRSSLIKTANSSIKHDGMVNGSGGNDIALKSNATRNDLPSTKCSSLIKSAKCSTRHEKELKYNASYNRHKQNLVCAKIKFKTGSTKNDCLNTELPNCSNQTSFKNCQVTVNTNSKPPTSPSKQNNCDTTAECSSSNQCKARSPDCQTAKKAVPPSPRRISVTEQQLQSLFRRSLDDYLRSSRQALTDRLAHFSRDAVSLRLAARDLTQQVTHLTLRQSPGSSSRAPGRGSHSTCTMETSQAVKQGVAVPNPPSSKPSSPGRKPNGCYSDLRPAASTQTGAGSSAVVDLTGDDPPPQHTHQSLATTGETLVKKEDILIKEEKADAVLPSPVAHTWTSEVKTEEQGSPPQPVLISGHSATALPPEYTKHPSKTTARKRTAPRKSTSAVPEKKKCIEAESTSSDDVAPSPGKPSTSKSTARKRTAPHKITGPKKKSPSRSPSPDVLIVSPDCSQKSSKEQHPAPLPPNPVNQPTAPHMKALPPRATLKVAHNGRGIVLNWTMTVPEQCEEIAAYQLYAYQEGSAPPSPSLWKKIGEPAALALPMACTLTQFQYGNKYHFAVRAVDKHKRYGPYSEPSSILIPK